MLKRVPTVTVECEWNDIFTTFLECPSWHLTGQQKIARVPMEEPHGAIQNSTDHMIEGPSKEHEHTKVKFSSIVIPKKTRKKLLIYYLQPT